MNKRKTIGRTLNSASFSEKEINKEKQSFTLASGEKIDFQLEFINASELAAATYVELETNGRDQDALTDASLIDITRTIGFQQFFPAIGRRIDNKIEILDGSRRRAAALIKGVGLNILVTDISISLVDARQLACDIQTAKEHNLREVGLRLLSLRKSGLNQKEIAIAEGLSTAKVTRAIQAATVPNIMLSLFPVQSELTYPDYKVLLDIATSLTERNIDITDVIELINVESFPEDMAYDDIKTSLIKAYRSASDLILAKPAKQKIMTEKLWVFDDKDTYARKRQKDRAFSYEFNRLPKAIQQELDNVIQKTLKDML